jgi:hypothetical protein
MRRLRERSDFDADRYREILTSIDWQDVSPPVRERLTSLR